MRSLVLGAALALISSPALSSQIEKACLSSERASGKRALCRCIQEAADMTLSDRDQRLAARFFEDPHRAQQIRQSDSRQHEAFWERYESFGQTAQAFCGR